GVVSQAAFPPAVGLELANAATNPVALARVLFADYVFAMEVVGVLLITAAVSALVLTHRRRLTPKVGQREQAEAKVAALPSGGRDARGGGGGGARAAASAGVQRARRARGPLGAVAGRARGAGGAGPDGGVGRGGRPQRGVRSALDAGRGACAQHHARDGETP